MKQNQQQAQPAPAIAVAQIRAQSAEKIAQLNSQTDTQIAQERVSTDNAFVEKELQIADANAQARREELALKRELALLEYANTNKVSLEKIKAELAQTAMRLQTQKELSAVGMSIDMHKHNNPQAIAPSVEPSGRAQPGQAFSQ